MNDDQQNSLELLLDTITNTFGGILFMALLVVVLLQLTSDKATPQPPSEETTERLADLESQLISEISRRDGLQQALVIQDQLLRQLATESNRRDLEDLRTTIDGRNKLGTERVGLAKDLVATQTEINDLARAVSDLDKQLHIATGEVDEAKLQLQTEIRSRTTTAKLPRMHETTKSEIAVVLRYGRLYFVHNYNGSLTGRTLNVDDFVVIESDNKELVATPKPYAGQPIEEPDMVRTAVQTRLRSFPKAAVYLAIAVWDDSFDKFIDLKNLLVDMGYEYRVIPAQLGDSITESSDVTPLVQ